MTDVVRKAKSGNDIKNGNVVTSACPRFGSIDTEAPAFYQNPPVSGVNGVANNGRLDGRFDDTQYYST